MPLGDYNYSGGSWNYNTMYCGYCHCYYVGFHHTCSAAIQYYPTTSWVTCAECKVYYVSGTFHSCPKMLESKPKYEGHTLECGCKVETVVVEHCDTLHKAPPKDE